LRPLAAIVAVGAICVGFYRLGLAVLFGASIRLTSA
jgi:hypothetical protein